MLSRYWSATKIKRAIDLVIPEPNTSQTDKNPLQPNPEPLPDNVVPFRKSDQKRRNSSQAS